ncbi:MAG TPA: phospholipase D-like domain-containing protein [Bryobacteraceae bacterium]|nr:phospholipase D-like domain-containing protein [Bryobacteraceae bacterium]
MDSTAFQVIAVLAIVVQGFLLFLFFFEPGIAYKIRRSPSVRLDSDEFRRMIQVLTDAHIFSGNKIEVLTNGEIFYEAELEAIRAAQRTVNLEAYIFQRGEVTRRFVKALAERAQAGVKVNVILDSIGSMTTWRSYFKELREAGGRVVYYNPLRWHHIVRFNNRTHRELIIVDGSVGFIGGAGFADHWLKKKRNHPRWRDTMFRVQGEVVMGLQSTFAENWVEAAEEILTGDGYFSQCEAAGDCDAMVVESSPSAGRSTRARMLYQSLIASAQKCIQITTPYFLPDWSARHEMVRAIKERGVKIRVIVPGKRSDHLLTRRSSRRLYGDLLKAGAEIYEYEPAMIHTKTMTIDHLWSVVGSTNFDHRSFGLNDEVNLACSNRETAARIEEDFERDLAASHRITYRQWKKRSVFERVQENLGWILERQQ